MKKSKALSTNLLTNSTDKEVSAVASAIRPSERLTVWEWAQKNVDYSRSPAYPIARPGKYDPDWIPLHKQIVEDMTDMGVREVVVCKNSQAGASENLFLNAIRYHVARDPIPILYVSALEDATKDFFSERIVEGLKVSAECSDKLKSARQVGSNLYFDDSMVICTWCRSVAGLKQRAIALALGDELSTWPENSVAMIRKRCDTFPYSHVVLISSPDPNRRGPNDEDPIFKEFEQSDKRYWYMPDPITGKLFRYEFGGPDVGWGLKWDQEAKRDDKWDINRVFETAHYLTPDGTVITEENRIDVRDLGGWVPTNEGGAIKGKHGYHMNAFYMPFKSGEFGHIAAKYIEAVEMGPHYVKVFKNEYLAEPYYEEKISLRDNALKNLWGEYEKGVDPMTISQYADYYAGNQSIIIMTCDVQKDRIYWMVCRWFRPSGDCMLMDWGTDYEFSVVDGHARRLGASRVLIDSGYRQLEVYDACVEYTMVPIKSASGRLSLPWIQNTVNPFEGTRRGKDNDGIILITFDADEYKQHALNRMMQRKGGRLWTYKDTEHELEQQITSEEYVNGVWKLKKAHRQNHLWDCFVYQNLAYSIAPFWQ